MIAGTIIVAVIGAAATIISALVYRKVGQVHVLVNSRLDTALSEIQDLKDQRDLKRSDAMASERMVRPENHQQ
jgi:hypothetical protein